MERKCIDANVILRRVLRDNEDMAARADQVFQEGAWTIPAVIAEVIYVLSRVYKINRQDISATLLTVLDEIDVERPLIMARAVQLFGSTRLDFVDCLLAAYHEMEKVEIFTFDKELHTYLQRCDE